MSKFAAQMSFFQQIRYDILSDRLLSRNNILDPDFFLRSNDVLKFRIFWSVLVTAYYINPEINEINGFTSSLPRINSFDPDFFL